METKSVFWAMAFALLSLVISTLLFSMAKYIGNKPLGISTFICYGN
jgi:hypothetical protein